MKLECQYPFFVKITLNMPTYANVSVFTVTKVTIKRSK